MLRAKRCLRYLRKCWRTLKTTSLYRLVGFDEDQLLLHMQYGSRRLLTRKILDVVVEPHTIRALGSYHAFILGIILGRLCLLEKIDFNVLLTIEERALSGTDGHFTIDRGNNIEYYDSQTGKYHRILLSDILKQRSLSIVPILSFDIGLNIGRKRSFTHCVYL